MPVSRKAKRNGFLVLGAIILLSTGIGIRSLSATRTGALRSPIRVVDQTGSFEVNVTQGRTVRVELRNVSSLPIAGYALSPGAGKSIEVDLDIEDLPPGGVHSQELSRQALLTRGGEPCTVTTVIFSDHSFRGDERIANRMLDRQFGIRKQITRGLELIEHLLNSPDQGMPEALAAARSQIQSLPVRFEAPNSADRESASQKLHRHQVEAGLKEGKETIVQMMDRLGAVSNAADLRQHLTEMKEYYQKMALSLI